MGLAPARSQLHQEAKKSCRTFLGVRISPLGHSSGWRRMQRVWRGVCFLFVLFCWFVCFLAVKDLNCTGSWEMGGGRRADLRGPGGAKSQGRREAVTQTIGVPPSHALSVCLSLFCLV